MLPRLHDQDRIFINKFAYHFEDIGRGDVVVFYYPRDPSKSYIKRVIALPGDRLEIDDGRVYVNGAHIPEPYVPQRFRDMRSVPPIVLPAHCVLRDGRSSLHLQRQPRLRPGGPQLHLRQSGIRLLAHRKNARRRIVFRGPC